MVKQEKRGTRAAHFYFTQLQTQQQQPQRPQQQQQHHHHHHQQQQQQKLINRSINQANKPITIFDKKRYLTRETKQTKVKIIFMQLRSSVILGWLASTSIHGASFAFVNEATSNNNGNLRQLEASHQGEEGDINCTLIKLPTQYKDNKVPPGRQKEEFVCQTGDGSVRSTKGVEQLLARLGANDIPSGETQLKKGKLVGNQVVATNDSTIEQEEGEGEVVDAQGLNCRNGKNCIGRGRKLTSTSVERSVLVLRVTAPDSEVTVSSDTIADSVFGSLVGGSDEINLASQYDKCSNGKLLFAPVTGSNIVSGVAEVSIDVDATEASKYDLMNAAWAEADSLGLPIHTTDNIIICLPPGSETGGAAGWVAYAYTNGRRSVYNNEWCTSVR
jgi:hypothetical protein